MSVRHAFASLARPILCYVTDREQFGGNQAHRCTALLDKVAEAGKAGVALIQLREKDLSGRDLEVLAHKARESLGARRSTFLVVNSRTDIALAAGADGVHLRSDDVSVEQVREVWAKARGHSECLVGVSCHSEAEVAAAAASGADYVVFGPVFGKVSAPQLAAVGFEGLKRACLHSVPVLALGGVTAENAGACLDAGAAGVAAIRLFQNHGISGLMQRLSSP